MKNPKINKLFNEFTRLTNGNFQALDTGYGKVFIATNSDLRFEYYDGYINGLEYYPEQAKILNGTVIKSEIVA